MSDEKKRPNYEPLCWIAALIITLVLVWSVNSRAYLRGQLSRNAEVADLNSKVADAALLLSQCKASAELARPIAEAQKRMADAALESARNPGRKHSANLTNSLSRLKALRDVPAIAGTTE